MAFAKLGLRCIVSINHSFTVSLRVTGNLPLQRFLTTLPSPPKRPLSPYMSFTADKREQVKLANPDVTKITDVAKIIGEMWRQLPELQKKSYQESSARAMNRYKEKYSNYLENLSENQRDELHKEKKDKRAARMKRRVKKLERKMEKPKKPATAFFLYVRDNAFERGSESLAQFASSLAENWKNLPMEDKEIYFQMYRNDKQVYDRQLVQWEHSMMEQGMSQLVRKSAQGKPKKKASTKGKRKARKTKRGKNSEASTQTDSDPSWMREE